jgi:two-component system OmpR family sensor kinase
VRRPAAARRARWPRWSLRTSLVGGVLALTALGLLVAGTASALALRAYLVDRTDDQLLAAAQLVRSRGDTLAGGRGGAGGLRAVVAPTDYVVEYTPADGAVRSLPSAGPRPSRPLSASAPAVGAGDRGGPVTVDGGNGDFRVVTVGLRDASVLVALPMRPVTDTVRRLAWIEITAGAVVLALVTLSVEVLVRRRLRPLTEITATATGIAAGDLDRRVPAAPPAGRAAATEVGRLSLAVAGMLDRIRAALRDRERSEERMRQFVADASHELRTPLTSIRGYAQLLRGGMIDAGERPDALRRVDEEAARMGALVDDLLFLARLDPGGGAGAAGGGPVLRRDDTDLAALARDAVADARAVDPDRAYAVTAPDTCPVTGDAAALRRVLGNLLANVRQHTPPGTSATVSVRRDGGAVLVEVADDGPGVPAAARDRLFDRFFRADPGRADGGTGLGLAIVAEAVRAHGGVSGFRERAGGGTAIWCRVPAGGDPPAP